MHALTELIKNDMIPALGVTEPGAIAFAVATARDALYAGDATERPKDAAAGLLRIHVALNSGMYKNAFTCGVPNSDDTGILTAAALGYLAGDAEKGLASLEAVEEADDACARALIDVGLVSAELAGMTSRIYICARVETKAGYAELVIRDQHTKITRLVVNDEVRIETAEEREAAEAAGNADTAMPAESGGTDAHSDKLIHRYTLSELLAFVETVPAEEISFVQAAYEVNGALFEEGLHSPKTTFARQLLQQNGGEIFSDDEKATAQLLCNAAIEARVIGLDKPAMSITGSGAHGIIATLPLLAVTKHRGLSDEQRWRATMLSYLICTYIKEYSGRLSAFCGCGIAAGTGMACALVYLMGGGEKEIGYVINNMASSITGMICDGGNQGCVMKGIAACGTAFDSAQLALGGVHIDRVHGINGMTPEETMRNMGLIASPGMVETERTIVEIQKSKHR